MIGRVFLLLMGVGAIAASAHISIMSSGGYGSVLAIRVAVLAALLIAGAYAVRYAWDHGMRLVAMLTFFVLLAGEAFVILMSATQQATAIEAAQAPAREASARRAEAQDRVAAAEARLRAIPTTSQRLTDAIAAKTAADQAAVVRAAEKSCAANCRLILQQQVDAASVEVTAAREEIRAARDRAERDLEVARGGLKGVAVVAVRNPVAAYIGVSEIEFALLSSILASLALNAGGTLVLAIAMHAHSRPVPRAAHVVASSPSVAMTLDAMPVPVPSPAMAMVAPPAPVSASVAVALPVEARAPAPGAQAAPRKRLPPLAKHVAEFIRDRLKHAPGTTTEIAEIHRAYIAWCAATGVEPRSIHDVMPKVSEALMTIGIRGVIVDGVPYVRDVMIRPQQSAAA